MAASGDGLVDQIWIELGGDATDFRAMFSDAVKLTETAAAQVAKATTEMTAATALELNKTAKQWDIYTGSIERARDAQGKFTKETVANMNLQTFSQSQLPSAEVGLRQVSLEAATRKLAEQRMAAMFGGGAGGGMAGGMAGGISNSRQMATNLHHLHAAFGDMTSMAFRAQQSLHMFGGSAAEAANHVMALASTASHATHLASAAFYIKDIMKMAGGGGAGAAAGAAGGTEAAGGMMTGIGAMAITAAAALATFTAALTGVTYVISGWEGIKNIPTNLFEGLKYGLYAASFGYLDYTSKTLAAKDAQKTFDEQLANNKFVMQDIMNTRKVYMEGMEEEIRLMDDHSKKAEKAFMEKLPGNLKGLTAPQMDTEAQRASFLFGLGRVEDHIKKLQDEAETYKMNRKELAEYTLTINHATAAQRAMTMALVDKMDAIDKAKEKEKAAEHEAKEREHEAKRRAEEAKRAHERLVEEAKSFHDTLRTPMEKLQDETKHAIDLFHKGVLSVDDLKRALKRLEEGPKEHVRHIKFLTADDIGVKSHEFGSVEELAAREAYKRNLTMMDKTRDGVRVGGLMPKGDKPDAAAVKREETETKAILTEMRNILSTISGYVDPKRSVRLLPARVGSGGK